jgi:hypothetical protein
VVLQATFALEPAGSDTISARLDDIRRWRQAHQPVGQKSAGSVFRNPEGDSAGRIIDELGLKGRRLGGAMVSPRHANFIVNSDAASAADVRGLAEVVRETVRRERGLELRYEVWDEREERPRLVYRSRQLTDSGELLDIFQICAHMRDHDLRKNDIDEVLKRMEGRDVVNASQYRSIYKSLTFPTTAYGVSHNLTPELSARIREAFFSFNWEGSALQREFADAGMAQFIPITYQEHWRVVREIDEANNTVYNCD